MMSPEPPPDLVPSETPPHAPLEEDYPFWGYLDLLAFLLIAMLGLMVDAMLVSTIVSVTHFKPLYVELPAQFLLYGFLLSMLALIFRRYYGRPFWQSLGWTPPSSFSLGSLAVGGVLLAFAVMIASVVLRTPNIKSPMQELLSNPTSVLLVGILGMTLGPLCEELIFRGFLQPVLIRSLGVAGGIVGAAVPFGLLHLQEYGYSWRHGLLITAAGATFGWMRHRTGSTKAAAVMHAAYNGVFFVLVIVQQTALKGRV
jgi:uncharacterized protein